MKKLLWILGAVAAVVIVAGVVVAFSLGSIVKRGVNTYGPQYLQTKVELNTAEISPLSGSGTLGGLSVWNPPNWSQTKAFYLGKIHLDVVPGSILKDHIVINEISIDQPEFFYETKLVNSNVNDLLKGLEGTSSGAKAKPTAKNGNVVKFEVKKFTLKDGKVTIAVGPQTVTLSMPPLELTDLGTKENGITADQLTLEITHAMFNQVLVIVAQNAAKIGVGSARDLATGAAREALQSLGNVFGGKK